MQRDYRIIKSNIYDLCKFYGFIKKEFNDTSLLESIGKYKEDTCRYSFIGVKSSQKLVGDIDYAKLVNIDTGEETVVNWLEILDGWTFEFGNSKTAVSFQLGAIGYIGYEAKYEFEKLKCFITKDHNLPDIYIVKYDIMLLLDRSINEVVWIVRDDAALGSLCNDLEERYQQSIEEESTFKVLGDIVKDYNKEEYIERVNHTIDSIKNGDIFQANITMRFHGKYSGDPYILYKELKNTTGNPFFAYLDFDRPVLSTSPERFIKINNDKISTYPIKGTIRSTINQIDQKHVLQNSRKNIAENTMITDLMRNDIGRICMKGSVKVDYLCKTKKFNQIYHLESKVSGVVKENMKISEVLKATFPGGSISGAPKIKSLDIIEETEFTKRGPYCGLIGFFGENGWFDSSIAIRTIYFDNNKFYFHAGGGIVADSIAEDEYDELLLKVSAITSSISKYNVLEDCRNKLNEIDYKLLDILNERYKVINEVAILKKAYDIPALQNIRMSQMKRNREKYIKQNNLNLDSKLVDKIYEDLIDYSMEIEKKNVAFISNDLI
jgi:anthranilate/para-aminobenzoate synthase component I